MFEKFVVDEFSVQVLWKVQSGSFFGGKCRLAKGPARDTQKNEAENARAFGRQRVRVCARKTAFQTLRAIETKIGLCYFQARPECSKNSREYRYSEMKKIIMPEPQSSDTNIFIRIHSNLPLFVLEYK